MGAAAGVGRAVQGMANSPRVQTSGQGKGAGAVQPTQPQVPAQGGKTAAPGTILNPNNPNNVPMAGGKAPGVVQPGQSPYTPIGLPPSQVPAQGGKAPLTPEQQADLAPYIDPVRPMPQVQQLAPVMPAQPQRDLGYGIPPPRPQVFPAQPQVMPRPVPQVMPRGLAGLRGRR